MVLAVLGAIGCEDGSEVRPVDAAGGDASGDVATEDATSVDATSVDATSVDGTSVDAGPDTIGQDASSPDTAGDPTSCQYVHVELDEGASFEGQYIASYDHRFWWWDQADITTVAFFEGSGFADYPNDRSFRFVALSQITKMEPVARADRRCYDEFRDAQSINVGQLPLEGASQILMGNSGYHRYEGGMGDFAWDFTRVDDTGARFRDDGAANDDYLVWDEPVYSPVSGYVVEVVRDAPDNTPGDHPDDAVNNLVGVHLGGAYYLYLLHFRQGTIPETVVVDSRVDAGDLLGHVGNSGLTLEPHLHLVVLWYDAAADSPRSWSVPTAFENIEVAPTPRGPFQPHAHVVPRTGDSVRPFAD